MRESNILPYDGDAVMIDDNGPEFDWPAITRTLMDIIPWQAETARIFGREMPIPRLTAWFGEDAYAYSGILHRPAPFPPIVDRLRKRAEALSGGSFNSALANLYRTGQDSVGWHSDHEAGLGSRPSIASLSLTSPPTSSRQSASGGRCHSPAIRQCHWNAPAVCVHLHRLAQSMRLNDNVVLGKRRGR
jgi:hypothetical protein